MHSGNSRNIVIPPTPTTCKWASRARFDHQRFGRARFGPQVDHRPQSEWTQCAGRIRRGARREQQRRRQGSGRRLVRHYDANGIPGPPDKVHIEERKNADGSGTIATTVLRSDINGNYALTERSNTDVRKSGDTTRSTTSIERPTLNGSLDMVEKREETRRETPSGDVTANATTYQRDANGRLYEAAREDVSQIKKNNSVEENAAVYEATNGQLQLVKQTVSRTVKTGDSSLTEMQVFSPEIAGRTPTPGSRPQLKEEKIIESRPTASGAVATTSIRSTSPNAPGQLGPARKVEETIGTGECK